MGAKNRLTHCTAAQKVGRGGQLRVDRVHSHMRTFSKASTNESKKVSYVLKVSYFQNEFMKSSFLPKYERMIVSISALCNEGRKPDNFFSYFGRNDDFINSF